MIIYVPLYPQIKRGLAQRLMSLIRTMAKGGINGIQYPCLCETQYGPASETWGYDPIRDLSVGQWPGRELKWGSATEMVDAINLMHEVGMEAGEDNVAHHYAGRAPLYEIGSDGKIDPTLFPKLPGVFFPQVPKDKIFDTDGDQPWGQQVGYLASLPKGYMLDGKIRAAKWRAKRFGLSLGPRFDAAKNMAVSVIRGLSEALPKKGAGAEVYTGNYDELREYQRESGVTVMDFPQYYAYRDVSNGYAGFRRLVGSGAFARGIRSAGYVESHDTDGENGIVNDKLWFYLHGATMPMDSFRIYGGDFEKYNLGTLILKITKVATLFAYGKLAYEYESDDFLVWSRDGDGGAIGKSGGLLCGISSDPIATQSRWVHTPFGPNVEIEDALHPGRKLRTNQDGWVLLSIGPNVFGSAQNGVAYVRAGSSTEIKLVPHTANKPSADFFNFKDF